MDINRILERNRFKCPVIDSENYKAFPLAGDSQFAIMENPYYCDNSKIQIFLGQGKSPIYGPFIDIYVWDCVLYPEPYKRFVICDGFTFSEKDEDDFFNYVKKVCKDQAEVNYYDYFDFIKYVETSFPAWHFKYFIEADKGKILHYLYFVSHRSGCREILYKAGLTNIAYNVEKLTDCNLIGENPVEIVNLGMPLKLIRIMDDSKFVKNLYSSERIEFIKRVYDKYKSYIGKTLPTVEQWEYLEALCKNYGTFAGMPFSRPLYSRLGEFGSTGTLQYYRRFFELSKKLKTFKNKRIPHSAQIMQVVHKLEKIDRYGDFDADILIAKRKQKSSLEYKGEEYFVTMPKDAMDICDEAFQMNNCVMDYIEKHAYGNTNILFVRKNKFPNLSYVTMEVSGYEIEQAFCACNEIPPAEVFRFLEEYAKAKHLYYDPEKLIFRDEDFYYDDEIDESLVEYLMDYMNRNKAPEYPCDNNEFEQITLGEIWPGFAC